MKTEQLPQVLNEAQLSLIETKTPLKYIKQRKARGGQLVDYVEIGYVIRQLNLLFGHLWDFEILEEKVLDDEVIVKGKLSVKGNDRQIVITKMQYGSSEIKRYKETRKTISVGDDLKAAASDSLKKCASLIGIALDVYTGESFNIGDNSNQPSNSVKPEKTHNGNGNSNKAANPMTIFWSEVYANGFSKEFGQKTLQDASGDPKKALAEFKKTFNQ